jgi:hypothetical protein
MDQLLEGPPQQQQQQGYEQDEIEEAPDSTRAHTSSSSSSRAAGFGGQRQPKGQQQQQKQRSDVSADALCPCKSGLRYKVRCGPVAVSSADVTWCRCWLLYMGYDAKPSGLIIHLLVHCLLCYLLLLLLLLQACCQPFVAATAYPKSAPELVRARITAALAGAAHCCCCCCCCRPKPWRLLLHHLQSKLLHLAACLPYIVMCVRQMPALFRPFDAACTAHTCGNP